jgi:hypothetical protein
MFGDRSADKLAWIFLEGFNEAFGEKWSLTH